MDESPALVPKRARKSAPVKNAIFIGAQNWGNTRNNRKFSERPETGRSAYGQNRRHPAHSRRPARTLESKPGMRMSTPVRMSRSPRYKTRYQTSRDSANNRDSASSSSSSRRFHPDYDPTIELRRAKQRLEQYRTNDCWKTDIILSDDATEDLNKYEEKLRRRLEARGELTEPLELERRQLVLLRRQRDIDQGKVTERYAEYVFGVPKPERAKHMPRTPNKFRKVSRRAWDGMIRKWRKHLHNYTDLNFEDTWRSLSSSVASSEASDLPSDNENSTSFLSISSLDELPKAPFTRSRRRSGQLHDVDEESTLQAKPRFEVEEDTLSALPTVGRGTRRLGPSPDNLHSGLTNDMANLAGNRKRKPTVPRQPFVDLANQTEFPSLDPASTKSPRKRFRRGILSQSGFQFDPPPQNSSAD